MAFRGDSANFLPRLVIATVVITVGAMITLLGALSAQMHIAPVWQMRSAWLGSALLVSGLLSAFVLLPRTLRDESSIQVRVDGLLVSLHGKAERLIPWDSLARIRAAGNELVLDLEDGREERIGMRFGGHTHSEFARILEQQRMRANLSMLR